MNKQIEQHLGDYVAACGVLNIPAELPEVSKLPEGLQNFVLAQTMLPVMIAARRKGWKPDYNNSSQLKFFPWWDMETYGDAPAGSGFSLHVVSYAYASASVGAPFVMETESEVREFTTKYIDLYRFAQKDIEF